ncbi:hypothetical protein EYV94_13785 [Puteibacter caeruleilacunae]|nr:hypothetical protein EYV94_13785 [Puteibacter caeruleilacunae]
MRKDSYLCHEYIMYMIKKMKLHLIGILFLGFLIGCENVKFPEKEIIYDYREIGSYLEIANSFDSVYVKPIIYKNIVPLENLTVQERKDHFLQMVVPAAMAVQFELYQKLEKITFLHNRLKQGKEILPEDRTFMQTEMKKYHAIDIDDLKKRLKPHPISLTIAQAIVESGWGTSRFCIEANNLFGVWSFNKGKNSFKAAFKRGDQDIYVRSYDDIKHSIEHYYLTLGRAKPYQKFREKRFDMANPMVLIEYLDSYSECRNKYKTTLRNIIDKNDLTRFDCFELVNESIVMK